MDTPAPGGTQSIQRIAALLRALSLSQKGLRLADVLPATGLSRPTAHRMLQALIREGMVRQAPDSRRYHLGPTIFELGLAARPRFDVRAICAPSLDRLAEETGDTAFLTSRSGFDSVCLDRREGHYPIRALTVEVGGRRPLGTTAGSLALLCNMDEAECAEVVAFNTPRIGRYGMLTLQTLRMMVSRGRTLGYALNENDLTPGVTGLGVALPPDPRHPTLALSVVALSDRLAGGKRAAAVALLQDEAKAMRQRLAHAAAPN